MCIRDRSKEPGARGKELGARSKEPGARSKGQGARGISKRSGDPAKCTAFAAGEHRDCLEIDFAMSPMIIGSRQFTVSS